MSWAWFGTDFILLTTALFLLLAEFTYRGEKLRLVGPILSLAWALELMSALIGSWDEELLGNAVVVDGVSRWFRVFAIIIGAFSTRLILTSTKLPSRRKVEGLVFLVTAVLSCHYLVAARDALVSSLAWVGLWVSTGFLLGLEKREPLVLETGLKQILGLGVLMTLLSLFVIGLLLESGSTQLPVGFAASPFSPSSVPLFCLLLIGLGAFPFHTRIPNIASTGLAAAAFPAFGLNVLGCFGFYSRFAGGLGVDVPTEWVPSLQSFSTIVLMLVLVGQIVSPWLAFTQRNLRRATGHLWASTILWLAGWVLIKGHDHSGLWLLALIVSLCGLGAVWFGESLIEDQGETRFAKIMTVLGFACLCAVPPFPSAIFRWGLIESAFERGESLAAFVLTVSWLISILAFGKISQARVAGILRAPQLQNAAAQWIGVLIWLPVLGVGFLGDVLGNWIGRTIPHFFW